MQVSVNDKDSNEEGPYEAPSIPCDQIVSAANRDEQSDSKTNLEVPTDEETSDGTNNNIIFLPCAKDGYIPNSVIRQLIQPTAPPDYSEIIKEIEEKEEAGRFKRSKMNSTPKWAFELYTVCAIEKETRLKSHNVSIVP